MIAIAYFKMKRRHLIVSGAAGATNSLSAAQLPRRGIVGVACLSVISTLVGMQRAYRVRNGCCAFVREILFASSHLSGMRCGRAGARFAVRITSVAVGVSCLIRNSACSVAGQTTADL